MKPHIETIMNLYRQGVTYSTIAEQLGIKRTQVAGIVYRNRTADDDKRSTAKFDRAANVPTKRLTDKSKRRIKHAKLNAAYVPVVVANGMTFADAVDKRRCLYMAGDDRMCCGKPRMPGLPWCEDHHAVVYVKGSRQDLTRMATIQT